MRAPLTERVARSLLGVSYAAVGAGFGPATPPPGLAFLVEEPIVDAEGKRVATLAVGDARTRALPDPAARRLTEIASLALLELSPQRVADHEGRNALMGLVWFARLVEAGTLAPEELGELLSELAHDARSLSAAHDRPQPARSRR